MIPVTPQTRAARPPTTMTTVAARTVSSNAMRRLRARVGYMLTGPSTRRDGVERYWFL